MALDQQLRLAIIQAFTQLVETAETCIENIQSLTIMNAQTKEPICTCILAFGDGSKAMIGYIELAVKHQIELDKFEEIIQ